MYIYHTNSLTFTREGRALHPHTILLIPMKSVCLIFLDSLHFARRALCVEGTSRSALPLSGNARLE